MRAADAPPARLRALGGGPAKSFCRPGGSAPEQPPGSAGHLPKPGPRRRRRPGQRATGRRAGDGRAAAGAAVAVLSRRRTRLRARGAGCLVLHARSSVQLEGVMTSGPNSAAMPGRSRYRIELSEEERSELEHRAACYSRPHREVQRAKLVLYAADGLDNVEIARRLDLRPEVVCRWRRRFFEERVEGLSDRPRAGRPRRFSPGRSRPSEGDRLRAAQGPRRPAVALHSR